MIKFKKTPVICAALLSCLLLTACGGSKKEITVDPAELAGKLQETVTSGTLSETPSDIALSTFYIDAADVESCTAYAGSGIASEIAVIKRAEKADEKTVTEKLQKHVDNQEELYASYNEAEAAKLKEAIIKSAGAYTVLCVCDDTEQALKILKDYGF